MVLFIVYDNKSDSTLWFQFDNKRPFFQPAGPVVRMKINRDSI